MVHSVCFLNLKLVFVKIYSKGLFNELCPVFTLTILTETKHKFNDYFFHNSFQNSIIVPENFTGMRILFCFAFLFSFSIVGFSQDIKTIERSNLPDSLGKDSTIYKADDTTSYLFTRPKTGSFIKNIILNSYRLPEEVVKKKNLMGMAVVATSTVIFLHYDEKIYEGAHHFGHYIGLNDNQKTVNLSPINCLPLYLPGDLSNTLFYIGDGTTELAVDGSFYVYGIITNDNRALRTSCELSEGIAIIGVYIQLLKHLSGRETPIKKTVAGGKWRWFISPKEYYNCVPQHDAYPSGHLATAMVTATIISMNYPEYGFIKPLCYTLMGICGFQMLNNGVHWMSDYPLAIAMGYAVGKIAVNSGRTTIVNSNDVKTSFYNKKLKPSFKISPAYLGNGVTGLSLSMKF